MKKKSKSRYVQTKNPITDEWIKIDTRTCTIINRRDRPFLYSPFATQKYADMAREIHRKRKEFVKDLEYAMWHGPQ